MTDGPTEIKDKELTEKNRSLVESFYEYVLKNGKAEKLDDYLGDFYHQHNPKIADGKNGFLDFFKYLQYNKIPFSIRKTHRSIAEGNFALLQSEGEMAGKPQIFHDLFRVEDGKIVEYWDTLQAIPEKMEHKNGKLLELTNHPKSLCKVMNESERADLLKEVTSNRTLEGLSIGYDLKKPVETLVKNESLG